MIQVGQIYFFTKSGNKVKVIEQSSPYMGLACWVVERTDGASAGKQMVVPERSLVTSLD